MNIIHNNTQQGLFSVFAGVTLTTCLFFMIQLLSAVQKPGEDNTTLLVLNLLELPQIQVSVKTEKRPVKQTVKKPLKQIIKPEKVNNPEPTINNTTDINYLPRQNIKNTTIDTSEPTSLPAPVPFYKLSDLPRFTHRETPTYPEDMRASGIKGTVKLMVLIDKTGKVRKITILKSAGKSFDQAAIDAINASSFMPAKVNGKPVTALLKMPVKFKLL